MSQKQKQELDVVSIRLVKDSPLLSELPIRTPEDAVKLLGKYLSEMDREVLCIINLKSSGVPINCNFASMGTLNYDFVHPREVFKSCILSNAASFLVMHNHPSGNIKPSREDIIITDRLIQAGKLLGIMLLDHIIVGTDDSSFFSFRAKNMLSAENLSYKDKLEELIFNDDKKRKPVAAKHKAPKL